MSLVTLAEAKLHLRVDTSDEDTLIQAYLNAAEATIVQALGRYVYADSTALTTALSGVQTALTAASTAYGNAITAAEAMTDDEEAEIAFRAADENYQHAKDVALFTNRGIVINDAIKVGILLTVAHMYANREATTTIQLRELPMGVDYIIQPHKAYV